MRHYKNQRSTAYLSRAFRSGQKFDTCKRVKYVGDGAYMLIGKCLVMLTIQS
jgi:hypothetical protein